MSRLSLLLSCIFLFSTLLHALSSTNALLQEKAIDQLPVAERLAITSAVGPESLAFDGSGDGPYTGVSDGRILKWQGKDLGWTVFAVPPWKREKICDGNQDEMLENVCGRPLGLQFNKATGELYIADAYNGLLAVGPKGGVARLLANEAGGEPFNFTNGLDIDQETGMVYFTDSSTHYTRRDYILNVLTRDATGRLLRYNPVTKELTVLRKGLVYPNGVAMSQDNTFLLVAETTNCRILRYWLRGPRTGTFGVFTELPGYPDNIKKNPKGEFWVALSTDKVQMASAPKGSAAEHPVAVRLSQEGSVLEVLEGKISISISEVGERNGTLWVGSVVMTYVAVYNI